MSLTIGNYDLDDDLIEATRRDRSVRIRVNRAELTAVVIGRGSKPETELFIDRILNDGIPVLKRHGGGCAVIIDPGNVVLSAVLPTNGIADNQKYFNILCTWLTRKLTEIGLRGVYREGISDLVLNDRKIGGSCIHRTRDYLYFSATLLVDPRIDLIERYLKHPPREPEYRRGRNHRDFLGKLPVIDNNEEVESLEQLLMGKITSVELEALV